MGINFPDAPTTNQVFMGYKWDGEKWASQSTIVPVGAVKYDTVQGLTATERSQARANIDVMKRNYVINGAMMISQENGTTASGVSGYYPVDMFFVNRSGTTGTFTSQQIVNTPTPGGSTSRLRVQVTTDDAAVASSDVVWIETRIEGLRCADLRFGTPSAKTVTVQFGVRTRAGTYGVSIVNATDNRSYVAEFTVSAGQANTDTIYSLTIPGDVAGTWAVDNTLGLKIRWALMAGTTYQVSAGAWQALNMLASPGQSNLMATLAATFDLFDVSLTEGTVAPPFQVPDYASELAACQRYYQNVEGGRATGAAVTSGVIYFSAPMAVPMRSMPTTAGLTAMTVVQPLTNASYSCTGQPFSLLGNPGSATGGVVFQVGGFTGLTIGATVLTTLINPPVKLYARL